MITRNACMSIINLRADDHITTQKAPVQASMDASLRTWFSGVERLYIETGALR